MFRLQRAFRVRSHIPVLAYAQPRRPLPRYLHDHAEHRVQRVRFLWPGFTWKRCATFALYSFFIVSYLNWLVPAEIEVEVHEVEAGTQDGEAASAATEEGEEEAWAESDSWFIPLTWSKKLPRTYYKGTDEEWQTFIKISNDNERIQRLHSESCLDNVRRGNKSLTSVVQRSSS